LLYTAYRGRGGGRRWVDISCLPNAVWMRLMCRLLYYMLSFAAEFLFIHWSTKDEFFEQRTISFVRYKMCSFDYVNKPYACTLFCRTLTSLY